MKKLILCVLFMTSGCYQYIDSGNVGVKVTASGTDKGINPKAYGVGRVWYNPMNESVHEFPVYEQNIVWAKTGGTTDESFTISSSQSAQISVDVGITFQLQEEKVPHLFNELRKDIDYIGHQWMRNHVREALSKAAERMETMQILGEGKSELLATAKKQLNTDLAEYGIEVKLLSFTNTPRPEAKIQQSIDETIQAQQRAKQAENKVAESKAIAEQQIETAKGRARSVELEAEAKLKASELEAKANKVLSESLTPELVRYKTIEKWNGELPRFAGQAIPFLNVDNEVKK